MTFIQLFAEPFEPADLAFNRLMEKYEPLILATANRYANAWIRNLRGASDRDDLVQIARVAFWDACRQFDSDKVGEGRSPENVFVAFATRTMHGRLSDHLKKVYKWNTREALSPTDEPFDCPDTSSESTEKELIEILHEWAFLLSLRERQYLWFTLIKGWTTRDIASHFGVSEHTVRSWKKSARKKLLPLREVLMKRHVTY